MNPQPQPIMTLYRLGDYKKMMQSRTPSNVLQIRKVQPTPQEVGRWQRENKIPA